MTSRERSARLAVLAAASVVALVACEKKKTQPASNPYQVGSVIINLPPSVQVPLPQGKPDAPSVNLMKCRYVVDKQIKAMTKSDPSMRPAAEKLKPGLEQECLAKWTQDQYDCMDRSKSFEEMVQCKRFQKP